MAKDAGIEISESRLLPDKEKSHFMTRRFDRVGPVRKLHYQSLHAIAHYNFNDLYQYSYEDLFIVMRQLNLPASAFEQQFRRMVFNILACVADDHTKNFGFLLHPLKNIWELSPAFDLTFTHGLHALSLNDKRRDFTLSDLEVIAKNYHIKDWEAIVQEVGYVVSNVGNYLSQNQVPMGTSDFVTKEVNKARVV
jgi:serine/threonine-protein kinase HipA